MLMMHNMGDNSVWFQ